MLAGDVKEPARLSQRLRHEGVVVWPLLFELGWGMLGDISYIKLLYNPRVNIVFNFNFNVTVIVRSADELSVCRSVK